MAEVKRSSEQVARVETLKDVVGFFVDHSDDPSYIGYDEVAAAVEAELDVLVALDPDQTYNGNPMRELELRPQVDGDPYSTDGTERSGTQALITLTYKTTGAEDQLIVDDRDPDTGNGNVVMRGSHNGVPVFFVESYSYGSMRWQARRAIPENMLPAHETKERKPVITTGLIQQTKLDLAELEAMSGADITAEAVMLSAILRGKEQNHTD